jgi:hypothetical protein
MAVGEIITDFHDRKFGADKDGNIILKGGAFQMDATGAVVDVTASTLTVTQAAHGWRFVTLNRAAGIAVTLPAAAGTGARYHFIIGTAVTSNATTIKVADADDVMVGNALMATDDGNTPNMFKAASGDDTITFDGSTTGGIKGDSVELVDIAANTWWVRVVGAATGSEATPFSATVS